MKKKLIPFLILFISQLSAQYNPTIRTGRPGQAIGAFTVGKNILQFQQGLEYDNNDTRQTNLSYVTNHVVRFGISELVEVSALINYRSDKNLVNDSLVKTNGLSNLHLGFRVHLSNQKGIRPATGIQMRLKMPNVSKNYRTRFVAPVMVFVAGWRLPKNTSLNTNWILSYNGNDATPTGRYVLNFSFPLYKKLSSFIENYGQYRSETFETRFDGGFAWLVSNNVQLDLSAGYGKNTITDYFVSGGISWRLNLNKSIAPPQNKTSEK